MAWHGGPAGVIGARRVSEGLPGTWEVPSSPARSGGRRSTVQGPQAPRQATAGAKKWRTLVPPSEGNEARRDGRRDVGAPRNTAEAGEPTRGTRRREGGAGTRNRRRERCREPRVPQASLRNFNG